MYAQPIAAGFYRLPATGYAGTGYRHRRNRRNAATMSCYRQCYRYRLPATGYAGTGYRRPKEPTGRCRAVQIETSDRARGHVTLTLKVLSVHSFLGGSLHRIIIKQSNASWLCGSSLPINTLVSKHKVLCSRCTFLTIMQLFLLHYAALFYVIYFYFAWKRWYCTLNTGGGRKAINRLRRSPFYLADTTQCRTLTPSDCIAGVCSCRVMDGLVVAASLESHCFMSS